MASPSAIPDPSTSSRGGRVSYPLVQHPFLGLGDLLGQLCLRFPEAR